MADDYVTWPAQFEPWSTRPWDRCSARTPEVHPAGDMVRCDLRKRHRTPYHRAERGMYHVVWTVDAGVVMPNQASEDKGERRS